jgi:nucleotide-binding universal stress UspA family protein
MPKNPMKKIIAPVDFSDASTNALSFAAEICKRSSAHLMMVNALEKDENEIEAKDKAKNLLSDLKKTFGPDLSCEASVLHGGLVTTLEDMIQSQRPDLIVMGTKGASGLKKILIGSNTVNFLSMTKAPVLVIPEEARFENFLMKGKNRVILATDLEEVENDAALDLLKEIALLIVEPKVRVLSVRPKNTHLDFLKDMERRALLSVFSPEIESERVTVFSDSVMSGINFYLDKHDDTGLVAMIARDTGHLVQKHYTREMASHTRFPLLVLHDVKGTNDE